MKKYLLILWLAACFGCSSPSRKEIVTIGLTDSGRSLEISGIDNDILGEINRDTTANTWLGFIPVYKMPQDTDMKDFQHAQPGKYVVSGNSVIFTPDTPFAKQQTYFLRWYRHDKGNTALDYIKSNNRLGETPYIDLVFKP